MISISYPRRSSAQWRFRYHLGCLQEGRRSLGDRDCQSVEFCGRQRKRQLLEVERREQEFGGVLKAAATYEVGAGQGLFRPTRSRLTSPVELYEGTYTTASEHSVNSHSTVTQ